MSSLFDHTGGQLKLVGHTDQVLERAWHAAAAIAPSKLVFEEPDRCKVFKNLAAYLGT